MATTLVVDDTDSIRKLLRDILNPAGYLVSEADSGERALELLGLAGDGEEPLRPDLIVLDVTMKGMDGFTVNNRLQEREETRKIPVVVLTAKGGLREPFQLASNVAAFIEKPFAKAHLLKVVRETLQKSGGRK